MDVYPLEVFLPDGTIRCVHIPSVSAVLYDIFKAELTVFCGDHDHFEYEDEDGDSIAVRSDEDLEGFIGSIDRDETTRIRLVADTSTAGLNELLTILPEDLRHIEVISHGQFGTVYKSLWIPQDRITAVKCIQFRDDCDSDSRTSLLRELQGLAKCCRSDFVVQLLGATVDGNTLSIVLELMDGGSLNKYLPIPPMVLRYVSRSILEGVAYLASVNVMHRDLKPENFVVNTEGFVKLTDFGVSKVMEQSIADTFVGTSVYMAPERIQGGSYRIESDIWSLGVSLLEMASGRFPFAVPGEESQCAPHVVLNRILNEVVRIGDDVTNEHGVDFKVVVENCVCRDVSFRWSLFDLQSSPYMKSTWPINREVIAEFVKSRQSTVSN